MRPYSEDLRERAVRRAEAGETIREIAAALRISPSCVSKWRKRQRGRVVFTNGVFDLLHPGHVDVLVGARACGDALVVGAATIPPVSAWVSAFSVISDRTTWSRHGPS